MMITLYVDLLSSPLASFFFFNDTATTEIYTLSLHDALPISPFVRTTRLVAIEGACRKGKYRTGLIASSNPASSLDGDRKSTRLNSSHLGISYAVFCLKKKNNHLRDSSSWIFLYTMHTSNRKV